MFSENRARVLLVISPMWDISLPPLGIAYLSSYLEKNGVPADILDINIETYNKSDSRRKNLWNMENYNLWSWENLFEEVKKSFEEEMDYYVEEILRREYKVIGFSLYGANVLFSIELAARLKRNNPDLFVIFGGPSCAFLHKHPDMPVRGMVSFMTQKSLLEPGVVDAFIVGEGEDILYNLVNSYFLGKVELSSGVILYSNGKYNISQIHPLIDNLDKIPFPAWKKFPLNLYPSRQILPILFSRGCINRCAFCNDWIIWRGRYRCRSALNIFKEMEEMAKTFGIFSFQSNDLLFNGNLKILDELADYLISADLNIHWSTQGLIRKEMSPDFFEKMKKSGLDWVTYGVESLSEEVLKKMNKKYSFEDIKEVLKNTKEAGIGVSVNFIVGFPNETEKEFNITKERLILIRPHIDNISSLNPCIVVSEIDLERFPEDFSITFSREPSFYYWESLGGKNTYEVRKKRALELSEFAGKLGIPTQFMGISDSA